MFDLLNLNIIVAVGTASIRKCKYSDQIMFELTVILAVVVEENNFIWALSLSTLSPFKWKNIISSTVGLTLSIQININTSKYMQLNKIFIVAGTIYAYAY